MRHRRIQHYTWPTAGSGPTSVSCVTNLTHAGSRVDGTGEVKTHIACSSNGGGTGRRPAAEAAASGARCKRAASEGHGHASGCRRCTVVMRNSSSGGHRAKVQGAVGKRRVHVEACAFSSALVSLRQTHAGVTFASLRLQKQVTLQSAWRRPLALR